MIAATIRAQRPPHARLLVVDERGRIAHYPRARFVDMLHPGDLVVANDAATLPASLHGVHEPTGAAIEVRLAGRASLAADDVHAFLAVVFGGGDFRTRTEDRPLPPRLTPGDRLALGPLTATIEGFADHPRLALLRFDGDAAAIWRGLARHGRPIQYAHLPAPLDLWDVWTPIAGVPAAFEPPSAGFALDWASIRAMHDRGITFATITHAAGISSTGDAELDRRLPFDEPYRIPAAAADAIRRARAAGGRVVAVGTTVVRALEDAAARDGIVRAGDGVATRRIGPTTRLRVVDAILSGTHEPGSSHYDLLRAFASDATLRRASAELESSGYLTHEFGDSIFVQAADNWRIVAPAFPPTPESQVTCAIESCDPHFARLLGRPLPRPAIGVTRGAERRVRIGAVDPVDIVRRGRVRRGRADGRRGGEREAERVLADDQRRQRSPGSLPLPAVAARAG